MSTLITDDAQLARISTDARSRVSSLLQWHDLLAPASRFLIVPSLRAPRLAVPAGSPRAAAAAATRHGSSRSRKDAMARRALAVLLRSGIGVRAFAQVGSTGADPGLLAHLSAALDRELVAALPLTAARANRKPVLHLLSPEGETIGFAKLGVSELTNRLVRREADALERLANSTSTMRFTLVPRVLVRGEWNASQFVVLSPLPTWSGGTPDADLLRRAMREISDLPSPERHEGSYPHELIRRLDCAGAALQGADLAAARRTRNSLVQLAKLVDAPTARSTWHGDWTAWNCCEIDGRVALWDWERVSAGVPAGFDALHYRLQHDISDKRHSLASAARECIKNAPVVLGGWSLSTRQARTIAALYLAELSLRYLQDGQREAGARGGDVDAWLTPAIEQFVSGERDALGDQGGE